MSFRDYLNARRVTYTRIGDFTREAKEDEGLPDAKSWPELRAYLEQKRAAPEAIKAAREVWATYQAKLRKDRPMMP